MSGSDRGEAGDDDRGGGDREWLEERGDRRPLAGDDERLRGLE